jgi:hypothetical protein
MRIAVRAALGLLTLQRVTAQNTCTDHWYITRNDCVGQGDGCEYCWDYGNAWGKCSNSIWAMGGCNDPGGWATTSLSCDGHHSVSSGSTFPSRSGAGDQGYTNNANCRYSLSCPSGSTVRLHLTELDLENGFDYVTAFDGTSSSASVIERFSGSTVPGSVSASGNRMYVKLTSDGSVNSGTGAQMYYSCPVDCVGSWSGYSECTATRQDGCQQTRTYTVTQPGGSGGAACPHANGHIETRSCDAQVCSCAGSHSLSATLTESTAVATPHGYANGDTCHYTLDCPAGSQVQLSFTEITTESNFDFITVYDGSSVAGHQLLHFSGGSGTASTATPAPMQVYGNSSIMVLELTADSSVAGSGFDAEFQCIDFDPCHADMDACAEPHPALAACEGCDSAELPTPAWALLSAGGATPAQQYPTVRHVCAAGLASVLERTSDWLVLAMDYHLQAAEGNSLVIAQQLCLERSFVSLRCLGGGDDGSWSGEVDRLVELHDQACALADLAARSELAKAALTPNEVKPLASRQYEEIFLAFRDDIDDKLLREDIETAALEIIGQRQEDAAYEASSDVQWYTTQYENARTLADGFASSIQEVQRDIDTAREALLVDEDQLMETLQDNVADRRRELAGAIQDANAAAKSKLLVDGVKTVAAVVMAVVAAPATGGTSLVAVGTAAVNFVSENQEALEGAYSYAKDLRTAIHNMDTACGQLAEEDCNAQQEAISGASQHLAELEELLRTADQLEDLSNVVLTQGSDVSPSELPRVALLSANLGAIDASVMASMFRSSSALGDVGQDVSQLVASIRHKLEMMASFYKAKLSQQNLAVRKTLLEQQAQRAADLAGATEERDTALESFYDAHLRDKCYVALLFLLQQVQAYEYAALVTWPGLDDLMDNLQRKRLSAQEYRDLLNDAYTALETTWATALSTRTTCGGGCGGYVDFSLSELPGNTFSATGELDVTIEIPASAGYSHVTFEDVQVFLLGLDAANPVVIDFYKRGVSSFLDSDGAEWTFTHQDTDMFRSTYNTETCETGYSNQMGSGGSPLCQASDDDSIYMPMSPYGAWSISVKNLAASGIDLSQVTGIRFAFSLSITNLANDYAALFGNGGESTGCVPEDIMTQCHDERDLSWVDPCHGPDALDCGDKGVCLPSATCSCEPGWTGQHCELRDSEGAAAGAPAAPAATTATENSADSNKSGPPIEKDVCGNGCGLVGVAVLFLVGFAVVSRRNSRSVPMLPTHYGQQQEQQQQPPPHMQVQAPQQRSAGSRARQVSEALAAKAQETIKGVQARAQCHVNVESHVPLMEGNAPLVHASSIQTQLQAQPWPNPSELRGLSTKELRLKAAAEGVRNEAIEAARDEHDPKAELIKLILTAQTDSDGQQPEPLTVVAASFATAESPSAGAVSGADGDPKIIGDDSSDAASNV